MEVGVHPLEAHIKHKSAVIVSGPSGSGKTNWLIQLLKNRSKILPPPERIIFCYSIWQPAYDLIMKEVPNVFFVKGAHDASKIDTSRRTLLILDDLLHDIESKDLADIFIRGCHHCNITVIFITQNLFFRFKDSRTISLNAKYFVLFNNPRDVRQIQCLAYQMYSNKKDISYFLDSYKKATSKPYGYLFVDLTQTTPDQFRLRADIFNESETIYIKDS
jgi:GTPase SAR1 family protein